MDRTGLAASISRLDARAASGTTPAATLFFGTAVGVIVLPLYARHRPRFRHRGACTCIYRLGSCRQQRRALTLNIAAPCSLTGRKLL